MHSLDSLPVEIVELVVVLLDTRDVCSLRLTSRTLVAKSSHGSFRKAFRSLRVCWLDNERLDNAIIQAGTGPNDGIGSYQPLEKLTLVGSNIPWRKAPLKSTETVKARGREKLDHLFNNLVQSGRLKDDGDGQAHLECLTLDFQDKRPELWGTYGQVYHGPFTAVLEGAGQTLDLAATFLEETGIQIHTLDLFHGSTCCALPVEQLYKALSCHNFLGLLANLRRLSIKLAMTTVLVTQVCGAVYNIDREKEKDSFRQLLRCCPGLEQLEVSWFSLQRPGRSVRKNDYYSHCPIEHIVSEKLPWLRRLSVGGVSSDSYWFLRLLNAYPQLESVDLEEVDLYPTVESAFEHLTTRMDCLKELRLCHIFDRSRMIWFPECQSANEEEKATANTSSEYTLRSLYTLHRTGAAVFQHIEYRNDLFSHNDEDRQLVLDWQNERVEKHGPPPEESVQPRDTKSRDRWSRLG